MQWRLLRSFFQLLDVRDGVCKFVTYRSKKKHSQKRSGTLFCARPMMQNRAFFLSVAISPKTQARAGSILQKRDSASPSICFKRFFLSPKMHTHDSRNSQNQEHGLPSSSSCCSTSPSSKLHFDVIASLYAWRAGNGVLLATVLDDELLAFRDAVRDSHNNHLALVGRRCGCGCGSRSTGSSPGRRLLLLLPGCWRRSIRSLHQAAPFLGNLSLGLRHRCGSHLGDVNENGLASGGIRWASYVELVAVERDVELLSWPNSSRNSDADTLHARSRGGLLRRRLGHLLLRDRLVHHNLPPNMEIARKKHE